MTPYVLDANIKRLILSVKNDMMTKEQALKRINTWKTEGFQASNQALHNSYVKKLDHAVEILNRF